MFDQKQPDFSEDDLKIVTHCPLCEAKYNPLKAKVLDEGEEVHLLHITCDKCGSAVVAVILNTAMGMSSVGLLTDLTPEDVLKFKDRQAVDADDVLSIHQELSKKIVFHEKY